MYLLLSAADTSDKVPPREVLRQQQAKPINRIVQTRIKIKNDQFI